MVSTYSFNPQPASTRAATCGRGMRWRHFAGFQSSARINTGCNPGWGVRSQGYYSFNPQPASTRAATSIAFQHERLAAGFNPQPASTRAATSAPKISRMISLVSILSPHQHGLQRISTTPPRRLRSAFQSSARINTGCNGVSVRTALSDLVFQSSARINTGCNVGHWWARPLHLRFNPQPASTRAATGRLGIPDW